MRAEIITVGTEILLGEIINSNAQYLARQCAGLGLDVYHHISCGDNHRRLREVLEQAMQRSDLILVSGGIGPTPDDITREVVAETWGRELTRDEYLLRDIECAYAERGLSTHENVMRQAQRPCGSVALTNDVGTAPGFLLVDERCSVACLPGPPGELRSMFEVSLLPELEDRFSLPPARLFSRDVLTAGVGEATVATTINSLLRDQSDPTIATYAAEGVVRVRLATRAGSAGEAEEKFAPVLEELQNLLGDGIFGYDDDTLSGAVGGMIAKRGMTLALAESCTGGLLAKMFTDVPGSSEYFLGGTVSYANSVKRDVLGVDENLMIQHGAVSEQVAGAMARGAARQLESDLAVSITGVAGPSGGTEDKPVGTVCFGVYGPWGISTKRRNLSGSRARIRNMSAVFALVLLRRLLLCESG